MSRYSFKAESSKPNSGVIYLDRFEQSTVTSSKIMAEILFGENDTVIDYNMNEVESLK